MSNKPKTESWRSCVTSPAYEVSDLGRVRRITQGPATWPGRVLCPKREQGGYLRVALMESGVSRTRRIHQLVAEAFIGPRPDGMETCHNNGDPSDNRLVNLRYDTKGGNSADRIAHGTANRGERHGMARLSEDDVRTIRRLAERGMPSTDIATFYDVSPRTIRDIRLGNTWSWLDDRAGVA